MTYYTLTPSGYVPADPQPVLVPEGYMVVKREPDDSAFIGKDGTPASLFESAMMRSLYRAMTQAGELK